MPAFSCLLPFREDRRRIHRESFCLSNVPGRGKGEKTARNVLLKLRELIIRSPQAPATGVQAAGTDKVKKVALQRTSGSAGVYASEESDFSKLSPWRSMQPPPSGWKCRVEGSREH